MTLDIFPKPRRKAEPAPVETTSEESQAELPEPSPEAMAESESTAVKRTRRGTRGGRKKDETVAEGAEEAAAASDSEATTETQAEAPAEEAPAKPVRRTRRTKAQIEAEAAAAAAAAAEGEANAESTAEAVSEDIIESAVAGEVPAVVEEGAEAVAEEANADLETPETPDEETAEAVAAAHVEDEFEEDPSESQAAVLGIGGGERRGRDRRRGGRGRDRDRTDRPDRERREPGIAASDFAQEDAPAPREQRDDQNRQPRQPREPREPREPRGDNGGAGASGSADPLVRAIENQNRQIGELLRAIQDDRSRRATAPNGAPPPRVGVFVDVANIELAADRQRVRLDWGRILNLLSQNRQLVRAMAYAPIHDDPSVSVETQRFVEPFLDKGFKIVTKPLKRFQDGSIKANVDIELALDVVAMTERLDVVCLVSGDGDFEKLVELVQGRGVRVEVVSFGSSTAGNLKQAADSFIDLQSRLRDVRV